jgi:hypothetical protein
MIIGGRGFRDELPGFPLLPHWITRRYIDERKQRLFPKMSYSPASHAERHVDQTADNDIWLGIGFTNIHIAVIECSPRTP